MKIFLSGCGKINRRENMTLIIKILCFVAKKTASKRMLVWLAKAKWSWEILVEVIDNFNTPIKVLSNLATHDDWRVRRAVAKSPRATKTILANLASDSNFFVRASVASNWITPLESLIELANDKVRLISIQARENLIVKKKMVRKV